MAKGKKGGAKTPSKNGGDSPSVLDLSKTTIVSSYNLVEKENELASLMLDLIGVEEGIGHMMISIASSSKKLTPIAKAKLRNDIVNDKNKKRDLKAKISKLGKELKAKYNLNAQKATKKSLRISARKDGYHKRYRLAIQEAISRMISSLDKDDITTLKAELSNLDAAKGDTLLMRSLSKAPHNLQTKVVTNSAAREGYLQYFRNELGVTKKAPKGKRRK